MSTRYHAPLADLEFLLEAVLDVNGLLALPAFAHVDRDIVRSVLREGAKFAEEILSPTNGPGDEVGARLVGERVEFPPGYAEAYGNTRKTGGSVSTFRSRSEGRDCPGSCRQRSPR